jgi:nitrile hydratase accessory protein
MAAFGQAFRSWTSAPVGAWILTWNEWAEVLAQELKADAARGEPEDGSRYYHCWVTALERLVMEKDLSDPASLRVCKEA